MIRLRNEAATFAVAVQFLTRAPIPAGIAFTEARLAASVKYYPLVGALVGAVCAGVFLTAALVLPATPSIIAAIAAGIALTGAIHEDGFADVFDGVGGGATRERALEIMKDSRLGAYGVMAIVLALAMKTALLAALAPGLIAPAFVAGHGLSRLSCVGAIATSRYARAEGKAKFAGAGLRSGGGIVALAFGVGLVALWLVFFAPAAIATGLAGLAFGHVLMRAVYEPKLGGYTGDALGAVQQASEIGFYAGLAAWSGMA